MKRIILITGGQRSGKSSYAEKLALSLSSNPIYMATSFTAQNATFIFVTNEIGSGAVSDNPIQRHFTDLQGWMNQYIASQAHQVYLMVSGIPVLIKQ